MSMITSMPPYGLPCSSRSGEHAACTGTFLPLLVSATVSPMIAWPVRKQFLRVQLSVPQRGVLHNWAQVILPTTSSLR